MKKRLVILLLMLPCVFSLYEDSIYKGNVWSGKPFKIAGDNYTIFFRRYTNMTEVYYPHGVTDLINSDVQCSEKWIYKTCVYSYKLYIGENEVPKDVNTEKVNISLNIEVFSSDAGVSVERVVDNTEIYLLQTATITTTVENYGEVNATSVIIEDEFPPQLQLQDVSGCSKRQNTVVWEGYLYKGDKKTCTYTVKAISTGTFKQTFNGSYMMLDEKTELKDTKTFKVEASPFSTEFRDNVSLVPEQLITLYVNMSAEDTVKVNRLAIDYPDQLVMYNYSEDFRKYTRQLVWQGDVEEDKQLYFSFSSKLLGEYQINYTAEYVLNSVIKRLSDSTRVKISSDMFYVQVTDLDNQTRIRLVNPTDYSFLYLDINVTSTNFSEELWLNPLAPGKIKDFYVPLIEDPQIRIEYRTQYGQHKVFLHEGNFTQETETPEANETPEVNETVPLNESRQKEDKPGFSFKMPDIDIEWKVVGTIAGIVILGFIILIFFITREPKSDLEKEIDKIKME